MCGGSYRTAVLPGSECAFCWGDKGRQITPLYQVHVGAEEGCVWLAKGVVVRGEIRLEWHLSGDPAALLFAASKEGGEGGGGGGGISHVVVEQMTDVSSQFNGIFTLSGEVVDCCGR